MEKDLSLQGLPQEKVLATIVSLMERTNSISQLEKRNPGSMLSKGITLIRKYTPKDSPFYPFVRYKEPYSLNDRNPIVIKSK
jgi:hypothetical protein